MSFMGSNDETKDLIGNEEAAMDNYNEEDVNESDKNKNSENSSNVNEEAEQPEDVSKNAEAGRLTSIQTGTGPRTATSEQGFSKNAEVVILEEKFEQALATSLFKGDVPVIYGLKARSPDVHSVVRPTATGPKMTVFQIHFCPDFPT